MSEKRYQVFVSATYSDLQPERRLLAQVLPALGCMPCGLDLNPSGISAWTSIKRLIDESDYYLLLVGSRYGSLSPSGVSYTHMEYVYATTKQKPVLVLLHDAPETRSVDLQELTSEGRLKLRDFRQLLQRGLTAGWSDERTLEMTLRQQMPELISSRPMPGWVRANQVSNPQLERENNALKQRLSELEQERDDWLGKGDDLGPLSEGRDIFDVSYRCKAYAAGNCEEVAVRSQHHGMPRMSRCIWRGVGEPHENHELTVGMTNTGAPPFAAVEHDLVTIYYGSSRHIGGIARGHIRLGHAER